MSNSKQRRKQARRIRRRDVVGGLTAAVQLSEGVAFDEPPVGPDRLRPVSAPRPIVAVVGSRRLARIALEPLIMMTPEARWVTPRQFHCVGVVYQLIERPEDVVGMTFAETTVLADADIHVVDQARFRTVEPSGRLFPHHALPGFRNASHASPLSQPSRPARLAVDVDLMRLWRMGAGERAEVLRKLGAALRPFVPEVADILETYDGRTHEPPPDKPAPTTINITYQGNGPRRSDVAFVGGLRAGATRRFVGETPDAFADRAARVLAEAMDVIDGERPARPEEVPMSFMGEGDE